MIHCYKNKGCVKTKIDGLDSVLSKQLLIGTSLRQSIRQHFFKHILQTYTTALPGIVTTQTFTCNYESKRDVITALTHDSDLIQLPVFLPGLCPGDKIPQTNGAQRDETEVDPIQKRPGHLHRAEHSRRRHEKAQNNQNQQQQEVDNGGWPKLHAQAVQEADGSEDQRIHELLDTDSEHQHGERDSDQSIEDGEGFSSVRQRSGVTITWGLKEEDKYVQGRAPQRGQQGPLKWQLARITPSKFTFKIKGLNN